MPFHGWGAGGQRIPDPSASRMHLSGSMCFFQPARSPEASTGPGHLLGGHSGLWTSSQHGDCEMPCGGCSLSPPCPWGCPAGRQCHAGSERGPQTPAVPPGLNSGCLGPPPPSSSFFPCSVLGPFSARKCRGFSSRWAVLECSSTSMPSQVWGS